VDTNQVELVGDAIHGAADVRHDFGVHGLHLPAVVAEHIQGVADQDFVAARPLFELLVGGGFVDVGGGVVIGGGGGVDGGVVGRNDVRLVAPFECGECSIPPPWSGGHINVVIVGIATGSGMLLAGLQGALREMCYPK
jgi:hypothetical protein